MKVVYKETITKKMDAEIEKANIHNKEIDRFILTREEYNELCKNLTPFAFYTITCGVTNTTSYRSIPIKLED